MITKERLYEIVQKDFVDDELISELALVSAKYEAVYEQLVKSKGDKSLIVHERALDRRSAKLRKKLGIYVSEPCGSLRCAQCKSYVGTSDWCDRFSIKASKFNNPLWE